MDPAYGAAYGELHRRHWWWRSRDRVVLAFLREAAPPDGWGAILDVGCGDGLLFPELARMGRPTGVEPMGEIVPRAERPEGRIHVRPFDDSFRPDETYGLVLMLDVLEHLDDPAGALAHAAALLEPGGAILVTVPAFESLWTAHDDLNEHRTRFSRRSLHPLLEGAGFEVRESRYLFQWLVPCKWVVRGWEAVRGGAPGPPSIPPRPVNGLLEGACALERRVLGPLDLPFGSSLMVHATRPSA